MLSAIATKHAGKLRGTSCLCCCFEPKNLNLQLPARFIHETIQPVVAWVVRACASRLTGALHAIK